MAAGFEGQVNLQHIAAHHTSRRVDDDVMADLRAFRVEPLQHAQRPLVLVVRHSAPGADSLFAPIAQLESSQPGGRALHRGPDDQKR